MVEFRRTIEIPLEFAHLALVDMSHGDIRNAQHERAKRDGQCVKQAGLAYAIVSDDQRETAVQPLIQLREPLEIQ